MFSGLGDIPDVFWNDVLPLLDQQARTMQSHIALLSKNYDDPDLVTTMKLTQAPREISEDQVKTVIENYDSQGLSYHLVKRFRGGGTVGILSKPVKRHPKKP